MWLHLREHKQLCVVGRHDHCCVSPSAATMSSFHARLQTSLLPLLVDPKPLSVRKRAYVALCTFGVNS